MVDRSEHLIDTAIAEGMETLLADVIKKYPILYDKLMKQQCGPSYQQKCDDAWNKISDEISLELDSCKSLWSCMKQKFIKHRKRLDNGEQVPAWPTYTVLHKWLDAHVKKRKSRNDYIKQMRNGAAGVKMDRVKNASDNEDGHEEWTGVVDDSTGDVQLKRKSSAEEDSAGESSAPLQRKEKKFKIEVISDNGTAIIDTYSERDFVDADDKAGEKSAEIIVLNEDALDATDHQIEVIELGDAPAKPHASTDLANKSQPTHDIDNNIGKIEKFLNNCVNQIERYNAECCASDTNAAFGKLIASMVRELPAEKHLQTRLNILQYASELIAKESNYTKQKLKC